MDARDWHSFPISRDGKKSDTTYKADKEAVEKRRKREALAEARALREQDPLDVEWEKIWSIG